jgi:hypothetical protein
VYLGTSSGKTTSYTGYIGEVLIYKDGALPASFVKTINDYLLNKWVYSRKTLSPDAWKTKSLMVGAYSMRLVVGDYTGPVVQMRRGTDNATQDFYTDATQSYLTTGPGNTGTSFGSWVVVGATTPSTATAYVAVWYDQSGKNNHATNTANNTTQPTLSLQNSKYVVGFQAANSTVLNITGVQPNTVCCHFYNTNTDNGTILTTNLADYSVRFGGTGANRTFGGANTNDWFYLGGGAKYNYVNGEGTFGLFTSVWNVLSLSAQVPDWKTNTASFNRIGQDGVYASRSITGYMSEMLLYSTAFTPYDMRSYYEKRFF